MDPDTVNGTKKGQNKTPASLNQETDSTGAKETPCVRTQKDEHSNGISVQ